MAETINYLDDTQTSEENIRTRLLNCVSDEIDKSEGSYIWDSLAPVAIELVFVAMMAKKVQELGYIKTTSGKFLDMRCEEHGIFRKEAVAATGKILIKGTAGILIKAGLKIATEADTVLGVNSVEYITTDDVTISSDGTSLAPIKAITSGKIGNTVANKIVVLMESNRYITSITNPEAITGGIDVEDDDNLRERCLDYVRKPGTSGNVQNYKQWAISVDGVTDVHVIPLWNGNGTVKVVILGADRLPANDKLVKTVQEFIAGSDNYGNRQAPIGATVTVVSAEALHITITAKIIIDNALTTIAKATSDFKQALNDYLSEVAFSATTIRLTKIGSILISQFGVLDYVELKINNSTENIVTNEEQVVIAGEVILSGE